MTDPNDFSDLARALDKSYDHQPITPLEEAVRTYLPSLLAREKRLTETMKIIATKQLLGLGSTEVCLSEEVARALATELSNVREIARAALSGASEGGANV